jgi:hypothetical protein
VAIPLRENVPIFSSNPVLLCSVKSAGKLLVIRTQSRYRERLQVIEIANT